MTLLHQNWSSFVQDTKETFWCFYGSQCRSASKRFDYWRGRRIDSDWLRSHGYIVSSKSDLLYLSEFMAYKLLRKLHKRSIY